MIIYLITNKINGKQYVGQTRRSLKERWDRHIGHARSGKDRVILNAIRKYGSDNFYLKEIDTATSLDELNKKEIYCIHKLNSVAPAGYNVSVSNERGTPAGSEFGTRVRNGLRHRRIPIIQFDPVTGEKIKEWTGIRPAARALKASPANIGKSCKSPTHTVKGYGFCYKTIYEQGTPSDFIINGWQKTGPRLKSVYSIDKQGTRTDYASLKSAALDVGVTHTSIWDCITGRTKSCRSKMWFYLN